MALATGRNDDAVATLQTMLRICEKKRDPRLDTVRAELRTLGAASGGDELVVEAERGQQEMEIVVEPAAAAEPEAVIEAEPAAAEGEDEFASDLAEADFYIQAGLPEDARAIPSTSLCPASVMPNARYTASLATCPLSRTLPHSASK